jgi:hypothetical protein
MVYLLELVCLWILVAARRKLAAARVF